MRDGTYAFANVKLLERWTSRKRTHGVAIPWTIAIAVIAVKGRVRVLAGCIQRSLTGFPIVGR